MPGAPDFVSLLSDADSLQLMLLACPDGVVMVDREDTVVLYTGASEAIFGFAPIEVMRQPLNRLFALPDELEDLTEALQAQGAVVSRQLLALRRDSEPFWASVSAGVLRDRYGEYAGAVYYIRDHTHVRGIEADLRDKNERLNELVHELDYVARHDQLTGLLNRESAMSAAESALLASGLGGRPFGVCVFDLDHFKAVNDSYGHLVGDEVLHGLARVLRQVARAGDIVGRFGGEEFIAFLPGATLDQVSAFGERVRHAIEDARITIGDGISISVTVSVGVSSIPGCTDSLREAIRIADDRLYIAKRTGRNRVVANDNTGERFAA